MREGARLGQMRSSLAEAIMSCTFHSSWRPSSELAISTVSSSCMMKIGSEALKTPLQMYRPLEGLFGEHKPFLTDCLKTLKAFSRL